MESTLQAFDYFFSVIKKLRAPEGCPWDKEQTPLSMRSDLVEEVFEAVEAISQEDYTHAKEELGDVLLNSVMIAYMYQQSGHFTLSQVLTDVAEKLVRRHPHVFKDSEGSTEMQGNVTTSAQVLTQWDAIKQNVEGRKTDSILDEVPIGFPPLLKATKLQKKAAKKGFDWNSVDDVEAKVKEEFEEVKEAAESLKKTILKSPENTKKPFTEGASNALNMAQLALEEEIGDLLFAVVNLARHHRVDPVQALCRTNEKFIKRFKFVEQEMERSKIPMDREHLEQMDAFWDKAKENGC
ncbi:MAG: nucleoside triphosphate pyrophosphohydrolase [Spirochaetaceae bacterium]|nr:nucleoside triphosphate pyrophosphohydrolase [Spirochaetaceae bacterium]